MRSIGLLEPGGQEGGGVSSPWILKDQLTQSQLRGQIMSTTLGAVHKLCRLGTL